jgi:hypothetical protein
MEKLIIIGTPLYGKTPANVAIIGYIHYFVNLYEKISLKLGIFRLSSSSMAAGGYQTTVLPGCPFRFDTGSDLVYGILKLIRFENHAI